VRFPRLRVTKAPLWAWFLLAIAPTVGYALARLLIEMRRTM
jgi:hypothetical protein